MQARPVTFLLLGLIAVTRSAVAQPPPSPPAPASAGIDHRAVACIVVAKYPKLKACFGGEVTEPRAYFHAEGDKSWYWVKMAHDPKDAPEPYCRTGILPRPGRKLIHRHIEYYLEDVGQGQRTKEYDPLVVRQARECKKDLPVAPISPTGPAGVFPVMPAGFAMGAFPTVPVAVATAAAAGTGVYFGTKSKDENPVTPTAPAPPPPVVPPPPPPPSPPPPPANPPLDVSCQADPKSGTVPLTVSFTAFASGGTGSYDYSWQFGDGGTSPSRHPSHTFTSTGTFDVILTVTSGDKAKQCERFITVNPASKPSVTLTFNSNDSAQDCNGPPKVTIAPPGMDCVGFPSPGTTCSQSYSTGTVVQITSSTNCGSEVCWSGACAGTSTKLGSVCTVTMDSDKSAGARFVFGSCITSVEPPAILAWSVDLDAAGAVGQVVVDGQAVLAESGRRAQQTTRIREGDVVVDAHLVRADGKPGTWRFEAQQGEAIEPGSLRVLQGDVALLTPTAVVFRLKGEAGERVSFSYRLRR
jgi:PKD repeat protein